MRYFDNINLLNGNKIRILLNPTQVFFFSFALVIIDIFTADTAEDERKRDLYERYNI